MKWKIAIVFTCVAASVAYAYEGEAWSNIHGVSFKQKITDADLDTYPSWNPLKDECPLSPSGAISLALYELKKIAPDQNMSHVSLGHIALRAPSKAFKDKWHYSLNFWLTPEGDDGPWFTVYVRLDGKVSEIMKVEKKDS